MRRHYSRFIGALSCLVGLLLLSTPLRAQVDISARLTGAVTDPSGALVPAAQLVARNELTGVETKTTSDERGRFIFYSLPRGTYTVTCTVAGFQTFVTSGIELTALRVVTLPITLEVGSTTATVEVSAAAVMVDTQTATVQTTINEIVLQALPVYGRDASITMQALMPGASVTAARNRVDFNGVVGTTNNFRIDGSDFNSYFNGYQIQGPTQMGMPLPPVENLAEFTVTTSVADASHGRGAGGQIEAVIKSGTNDLHGQVWGYFKNGAWNANSWSNNWRGRPKDRIVQQWYGGNVGGPVVIPNLYDGRNRTFFFTAYERTKTSSTSTTTGGTITDEEREGIFTNSPNGIPVINGVPTPIIPVSSFSELGQFVRERTDVIPRPTSGLYEYTWNPTNSELIRHFAGKIDHNFSEKHRVFGSLWWTRDLPEFDNMYYIFQQAGWSSHYPNPKATFYMQLYNQNWTINDTYTISDTMVNNVVFGVHRFDNGVYNTYDPSDPLFDNEDIGSAFVPDSEAAEVQNIYFPRALGQGAWNGYKNPLTQNSWQLADNFTMTKGRHTIEAGVELRRFLQKFFGNWDAGLSFSDGNIVYGGTGNGIADMLLSLTPNYSQTSNPMMDLRYPTSEVYFQDTFKLSRSLTLTAGIRWQPFYGVRSPYDTLSTFVPGQASTVFPTAPVGVVSVGDQGIPSNLVGNKWAELGPRASIAWDIFGNGKAAFRAGYALMNTFQTLQSFNTYSTSAPYGISYRADPEGFDLADPYAQYGSVPFPWTPPSPGDPRNATLVFPDNLNTLSINQNYTNGKVHQFNFMFEIEPFRTYLFSVGYVGSRATYLAESHDINYPRFVPGGSSNDFDNVMSRRPWGAESLQQITEHGSDFNSMYNSLQVAFTKRYSHGLTYVGNYTLSSLAQQHGVRNWANAGLDYYSPGVIHSFSIGFSYALPVPTGRTRISKALLGGWTIGGNVRANSGQYGSVGSYNCGTFNYGSAGCYATFTGGSPYSPNKGAPLIQGGSQAGVYWLDASKFINANEALVDGVPTTSPEVGQRLFLGNAIVGTYQGPGAFLTDLSLRKEFAINERWRLSYRIEAVNAFNHVNLSMPGNTTFQSDMTQFGRINSAGNPRQVQMSAHIIF